MKARTKKVLEYITAYNPGETESIPSHGTTPRYLPKQVPILHYDGEAWAPDWLTSLNVVPSCGGTLSCQVDIKIVLVLDLPKSGHDVMFGDNRKEDFGC